MALDDDVARESAWYMQRKLTLPLSRAPVPRLRRVRLALCVFFFVDEQLRRLAVEIEVKHGRLALGAVVCAMAQQGILTVAA